MISQSIIPRTTSIKPIADKKSEAIFKGITFCKLPRNSSSDTADFFAFKTVLMHQKRPTRPGLERKTRRKEGTPSKELLLVRLLVSGLGLEPRWLLNRLKTEIKQSQFLPCQVQRKVEDKERAVAFETGKAKEESLKVAGARCGNRILLRCLQETGDMSICFSWKVILVAGEA